MLQDEVLKKEVFKDEVLQDEALHEALQDEVSHCIAGRDVVGYTVGCR